MIFVFSSCTKQLDFNENLINGVTNIDVNIYRLPGEPYPDGSYYREVSIYGTKEDFIAKVNPVYYIFHQSPGLWDDWDPIRMDLLNYKYSALFIRASLWRKNFVGTNNKLGTFIYNNDLTLPKFNCIIHIFLSSPLWKQEL